jgi:hypothetical protein
MDTYKDALIRQVFDLERDITFTTTAAEEAKVLGVEPQKLEFLREAFNQHLENRDWEWWQKRAQKKYSVGELADMLEDATRRADALGMQQREQSKGRKM